MEGMAAILLAVGNGQWTVGSGHGQWIKALPDAKNCL